MTDQTWDARLHPHADEVHVLPVQDLIEHTEGDCVCGPATEPVKRPDGSVGWLITHNSLDGREAS